MTPLYANYKVLMKKNNVAYYKIMAHSRFKKTVDMNKAIWEHLSFNY